ncbi:MAG: rRNA pseudouridine synthase [Defluviitaleaceae bacterium]|nr:rRNA pseudouridine synthase [Defluviitaleaceae bacterium]
MEVRLQKLLAQAGIASRRKSEEIIAQGRVSVDGAVVSQTGAKVDESAEILVDGKKITREKKIYILLNKPEGVVTTVYDPQGRPVVTDYAPCDCAVRLFPVGRLDADTSGMIFLTNDGDWANNLMHPSREIGKTYIAVVKGKPDEKSLQRMRDGIKLDGRKTSPAEVIASAPEKSVQASSENAQKPAISRLAFTVLNGIRYSSTVSRRGETTSLRIKIHEGRNRQVRRMCDAIGHPAVSLRRVAIGPISLGDLQPGKWRYLSKEEIEKFGRAVK